MPYVPSKKTDGKSTDREILDVAIEGLAKAICDVSIPYKYDGAFLGELNYSITRLIQRIPQIMVDREIFKSALRYWIYAGIVGVLIDIKDEYKRRVNTSYEAAQIVKSGDCYDTPFYTKLVEIIDQTGKVIGHQEVMIKKEDDNGKDILGKMQIIKEE
jgi:hypothetical protein